ncbi:MAG: HipA domain-containing protein [Eubacterium sp.]|nr:HipA domain-containing protein [Eubacterium sp.]
MVEIYDFNGCPESYKYYGGNAGHKLGIQFDGNDWFLKFPKSTSEFRPPVASYTTSPLSEYIGSHIYEMLGVDVHKTLLGVRDNKIVCACQDFLKDTEKLYEFSKIKNNYSGSIDNYSGSTDNPRSEDLGDVIKAIKENTALNRIENTEERFWQMFIIDALIDNNDRNNGNWGVIRNEKGELRLAPVFDNGNCFNNYMADLQMLKISQNQDKWQQSFVDSKKCYFSENGKQINPLQFILSHKNREFIKVFCDLYKKMDIEKILGIFDEIYMFHDDIEVISDERRDFYKKGIKYRYENVFVPVYNRIVSDLQANKRQERTGFLDL